MQTGCLLPCRRRRLIVTDSRGSHTRAFVRVRRPRIVRIAHGGHAVFARTVGPQNVGAQLRRFRRFLNMANAGRCFSINTILSSILADLIHLTVTTDSKQNQQSSAQYVSLEHLSGFFHNPSSQIFTQRFSSVLTLLLTQCRVTSHVRQGTNASTHCAPYPMFPDPYRTHPKPPSPQPIPQEFLTRQACWVSSHPTITMAWFTDVSGFGSE